MDNLPDHMLIRNRDLFAILIGQNCRRQPDLLDHPAHALHHDRISDHEGATQDDRQAGAIVEERALKRKTTAENQGAQGGDDRRNRYAELADRDNYHKDQDQALG